MNNLICEHCGDDTSENNSKTVSGETICHTCIKKHYTKCECGEIVPKQYYYSENKTCYICSEGEQGYY